MKKNICIAVFILGIISLMSSTAEALIFSDNFNDNSLDSFWWTATSSGGSTVQEINNRIEMTQGASGAATLTFNFPIQGNYYAYMDYQLLNWPSNNKERSAILGQSSSTTGPVERISDSGYLGEVYLTHFDDGVKGYTVTTDTSGKLRVERSGTTLTGSYWNGSGWTAIHSYGATSTSDATIALQIWPGSQTTPGVKVGFDNFVLNSPDTPNQGSTVPEPATMALFGIGLLGAGTIRRRRRDGNR